MPLNPVITPVDGFGFSLSAGGDLLFPIAAGVATPTTVKPSPGRLCRIVVTATGTGAVTVYDNASAASGTVIGVLAASAPVGVYDFQMPARNGITVSGAATNPAMTIGYV